MPGRPYTFGRLQAAQALGDLRRWPGAVARSCGCTCTDRAAGIAQLLAAAEATGDASSPPLRDLPPDGAAVWPGTPLPNPLRDPRDRRLPRVPEPCALVVFGVTGDLARKKLHAGGLRPGQPRAAAARLRAARLRPPRLG